jgi:hypothetical protein
MLLEKEGAIMETTRWCSVVLIVIVNRCLHPMTACKHLVQLQEVPFVHPSERVIIV